MGVDYIGTDYSDLKKEYLETLNDRFSAKKESQIDEFYEIQREEQLQNSKIKPAVSLIYNEEYNKNMVKQMIYQPLSHLTTRELLTVIKQSKQS